MQCLHAAGSTVRPNFSKIFCPLDEVDHEESRLSSSYLKQNAVVPLAGSDVSKSFRWIFLKPKKTPKKVKK